MIRVFKQFDNTKLRNFIEKIFFIEFMKKFNPYKHKCPKCKTKHPNWKKHSHYNRYFITFENNTVIYNIITVTRYQCSSCGSTHAILPEIIIPYRSYSFLFIVKAMKDYFAKSLTIVAICDKYNISVSTLYAWKALYIKHKKLWLGLLENLYISDVNFLDSIFSTHSLEDFFVTIGISFLQNHIKKAKYKPP